MSILTEAIEFTKGGACWVILGVGSEKKGDEMNVTPVWSGLSISKAHRCWNR
jgi:hypothetical protein